MTTPGTVQLTEPCDPNDLYRLALAALPGAAALPLPGDSAPWTPAACYRARGTDGADVIVSAHGPVPFAYRIDCEAHGIHLDTGTSCEELAHDIATAIAEGMLAVRDA